MKALLKFSILLCVLKAANFWMLWYIDERWVLLIALFFYIICNRTVLSRKVINKKILTVSLLLFAIFLLFENYQTLRFTDHGLISYSKSIIKITLLALFVYTDKSFAKETLNFIAKFFAIVLSVSMILYITLIFRDLPFFPTPYINSEGEMPYGIFQNYIILLRGVDLYSSITRFQGPFLEPGQIGTFLAFLLTIYRYDFSEKWRYVLLIALLFTLSLAGYLLAAVGFLLTRTNQIGKFVLMGLLLTMVYFIGTTYNDGDNILNEYIFERLEYDEERGIEGNNRNGLVVDLTYDKVKSDISTFMFGTKWHSDFSDLQGSTGYKSYIIFIGFAPLIFLLLFFILSLFGAQDHYYLKFGIVFLIVYTLSFMQRPQTGLIHIYLFYLYAMNNPLFRPGEKLKKRNSVEKDIDNRLLKLKETVSF